MSLTPILSAATKLGWFRTVSQLQGSVAPIVLPRALLFSGFGFLAPLLDYFDLPVSLNFLGDFATNVACNLVLGLLLVFRTNTAYERFWEGRRAWGTLVVSIRNLAREIRIVVAEVSQADKAEKATALRLLPAFAIATKLHLRQEPSNQELEPLVSSEEMLKLKAVKNRPLEITLWIGDYLHQQQQYNRLDIGTLLEMKGSLNSLVESLTSCERIAKTPIPIAYAIYLKRLILIYCICLPFSLVNSLNWWTGLVVALISYILLGIEEIGNSIEDPFGYGLNDLPLDQFCDTVLDDVEGVIAFAPGDRSREIILPMTSQELSQASSW